MKNITLIRQICIGVVILSTLWAGFGLARLVVHSEAEAATAEEHEAGNKTIFSIIQDRRYVGALYRTIAKDPDQIKEVVADDLRKMFKTPELERKEGALTVWQYRSDRCVLDIYFNGGIDTPVDYVMRARRTAYFEVGEGADNETVKRIECLRTIAAL